MNKTSIEWTDYTWNPVTGCLHKCRRTYCYNTMKYSAPLNRFGAIYIDKNGNKVREKNWRKREDNRLHIAKKGEIYPYGYDPTFYPHRLDEPLKRKKRSKIFVVDAGDLYGKWVSKEWVDQVFEVIRQCYWHTFQFLTKNPKRLLRFTFPHNAWVGTSINSDADRKMVDVIKDVNASVRYLSIEPLLGEATFDLRGLQWIIIGAQTGENPVTPKKEWIEKIIMGAERYDIPVFMKSNIKTYYPYMIQHFPVL